MCAAAIDYYLGANSKNGFYSLYDHFVNCETGDFLWAIKGGPGCGKSSFMKKIAAAALESGLDVERIRCSGDPESLDGVYIPQKKLAFVDGTAPHVMEVKYPAAGGAYLDLGQFYDRAALKPHLEELVTLNRRYKGLYERAYDCIAAANAVGGKNDPALVGRREVLSAQRRAERMAHREFGKALEGPGKEKLRFLSAFSYEGFVRNTNTVSLLCPRVCSVDDGFGLASVYLSVLRQEAAARELDRIICPHPIDPERLEALLLPQLGLAFIAGEFDGELYRHIRLDALVDREKLRSRRSRLRRAGKLKNGLLLEAQSLLLEAKQLHDELEAIYNPHVDFDGVYALVEKFKQDIF